MNNKVLGTKYEQEVCDLLAANGFWVHFISPAPDGSQPFDIIAVKQGQAFAIDCKTCVENSFPITRLEDNQIMAFEKWLRCGNSMPMVYVKHNEMTHVIQYDELKKKKRVKLS